ncbi:hypothetical protein [Rhodococcus daqingensis]|uniref:Uncharacterized protein n=1 Tax=Rhodococcus daqingensis TaxID=2479363 RepID=A0ABW2RSV5_9NOCA
MAPITAAAAGVTVGDIAAPQGMTVQALIAARNAGFPVYEALQVETYGYSKGEFQMVEYRRVYDINVLSSPTTKIVTVGAVAPDTFYVQPESADGRISVNKHEAHHANVSTPMTEFDRTTQRFQHSPLVRLPDGGPSVGIALVR